MQEITKFKLKNRKRILQADGELYEILATDEGGKHYLHTITAPRVLWLKIGSPVILLKNLTDTLVNGLRGEVTEIREKSLHVYFTFLDKIVPLGKEKFTRKLICYNHILIQVYRDGNINNSWYTIVLDLYHCKFKTWIATYTVGG